MLEKMLKLAVINKEDFSVAYELVCKLNDKSGWKDETLLTVFKVFRVLWTN